jgi:hypothetical protein
VQQDGATVHNFVHCSVNEFNFFCHLKLTWKMAGLWKKGRIASDLFGLFKYVTYIFKNHVHKVFAYLRNLSSIFAKFLSILESLPLIAQDFLYTFIYRLGNLNRDFSSAVDCVE